MVSPTFWKGQRVFITGHTGFKGSWLTLWLSRLGAKVTGYALPPPTHPNLFTSANVRDTLAAHAIEDVRCRASLHDALQQATPNVVFHLAAQSLVRTSYTAPVETFETNIMGTVNLLNAVRHCESVGAVVIVTTDKCYAEQPSGAAHAEDDRLGGYDPYASSKACAEHVTAAYRSSYFGSSSRPHVCTVRAGNIVGGGDFAADRLVPDLVRARLQKHRVTIRSPEAIRPWQFVLDALHGYLLLAEKLYVDGPAYAEAWNFGPQEAAAITVGEVVEAFEATWPSVHAVDCSKPTPEQREAPVLRLDSTKAHNHLGWTPRLSFAETIRWTAEWYRTFADGGSVATFTDNQIEQFEDLL